MAVDSFAERQHTHVTANQLAIVVQKALLSNPSYIIGSFSFLSVPACFVADYR